MSDLISRQAAIDALGDAHFKNYGNAILVIKDLPSAEPHWIPVSERLPRRGQKVLVCTKEIIAIDSLEQLGWRVYRDGVIAWMPLPRPYKC